jgi:hypothetical protein
MSCTYRLYLLDSVGHLQSAEWFEAEGDDVAMTLVEAKHPNALCEIWFGSRMVANLIPRRQWA